VLALAPSVTVAIGHDDQAVAVGDTDLLNYLLLNLIDHALVRLSGGGGVALSLSLPTARPTLSRRDTCSGSVPEERERIVERFDRPGAF